jgi:hypothetical protein
MENKVPLIFNIFIQSRNKYVEMLSATQKHNFHEFCKGLINKQDRILSLCQIVIDNYHVAHGRKFQSKGPKKDANASIITKKSPYDPKVGVTQEKD